MNRTYLNLFIVVLFLTILSFLIYRDNRSVKVAYFAQPIASIPTEQFYGSGNSMEPIIHSGATLDVQQIPYRLLKRGMIVVFMSGNGRQVCHVLIGQDRIGWITRGVNNAYDDTESMTESGYIGVVVKAQEKISS